MHTIRTSDITSTGAVTDIVLVAAFPSSTVAAAARVCACTLGVISPPGVSEHFLLRNARAIRIFTSTVLLPLFRSGQMGGRGSASAAAAAAAATECSENNNNNIIVVPPVTGTDTSSVVGECRAVVRVKSGRYDSVVKNIPPPETRGKRIFFRHSSFTRFALLFNLRETRVRNTTFRSKQSVTSTRRDFNYHIIRFNPV